MISQSEAAADAKRHLGSPMTMELLCSRIQGAISRESPSAISPEMIAVIADIIFRIIQECGKDKAREILKRPLIARIALLGKLRDVPFGQKNMMINVIINLASNAEDKDWGDLVSLASSLN